MIYPIHYEADILDSARRVLEDIPECARAEFKVKFFTGFPVLIIAFESLGFAKPAFAIALVGKDDSPLQGDRLVRHIRRSTETFLTEQGVVLQGSMALCPNTQ